jgi:invasion protein IalB
MLGMSRLTRSAPLAAGLAVALGLAALWPAAPALAQQPARPRKLGDFGAWTAATHTEAGHKVCYAFTRASRAEGVPNRAAANVLLVVTHRNNGRDQVAVRVGYHYARNTDSAEPVRLVIGTSELGFYSAGESAFARDNRAAVAALRAGREALARGPGPNGRGQASDLFSLTGFAQAYDSISRECPAPAPRR